MASESFEVDFGDEVGKKTFKDAAEFEQWLKDEESFWGWIHSTSIPPAPLPQFTRQTGFNVIQDNVPSTHYRNVFSGLRTSLQQLKSKSKPDADLTPYIETLQKNVHHHYIEGATLHSAGPRAKFVMQLKEKSPLTALYALGFFCHLDMSYLSYAAQQGSILASDFERGFADRTRSERESLEQLRNEWRSTLDGFKSELTKQTDDHRELNTKAREMLDDQKRAFAELINKETNAWDALHKTYDEKLTLLKPVQYWTRKAVSHRRLAWWFGGTAIFVGSGILWSIYDLIQITVRPPAGTQDVANWHPEYWRIAVLIAVVGYFEIGLPLLSSRWSA